jgi:hypothetical protein
MQTDAALTGSSSPVAIYNFGNPYKAKIDWQNVLFWVTNAGCLLMIPPKWQ